MLVNLLNIYFEYSSGADPEILHGRWPKGWLSILNYTGATGWLVNNAVHTIEFSSYHDNDCTGGCIKHNTIPEI